MFEVDLVELVVFESAQFCSCNFSNLLSSTHHLWLGGICVCELVKEKEERLCKRNNNFVRESAFV